MIRIAMALAALGTLASCTGTPMMGQGMGAANGVATPPAVTAAPESSGVGDTGMQKTNM